MTKEFTIPFLKTSDIEGILRYKDNHPIYDKGIKTLRLIHNRLEHVVEEESFRSDEDGFEMKELSVIKKIEKLKEEMGAEEQNRIGGCFKQIVAALTILFLLIAVLIIASVSAFDAADR
jgi:hypothetical protein